MMEFDKVLDNGDRQEFDTGSKRDTAEGKGAPHLIAGEVMADLVPDRGNDTLTNIERYLLSYCDPIYSEDNNLINIIEEASKLAIQYLFSLESGSWYNAFVRFSKHYENGAKKYGDNNWRKGQPISRYYDSAMRHLWKLMDNDIEEDHASALLWNLTCILQTKKDIKRGYLPESINDFPFTASELFPNK